MKSSRTDCLFGENGFVLRGGTVAVCVNDVEEEIDRERECVWRRSKKQRYCIKEKNNRYLLENQLCELTFIQIKAMYENITNI